MSAEEQATPTEESTWTPVEPLDHDSLEPYTPDTRPWLYVGIVSAIDAYTRPPTVEVLLRVRGDSDGAPVRLVDRPDRVYRTQGVQTAAESALRVLAGVMRATVEPLRIALTTDDPTVISWLSGDPTPPWLADAADAYQEETCRGVSIEQIELRPPRGRHGLLRELPSLSLGTA